jgi:hypothetical protein
MPYQSISSKGAIMQKYKIYLQRKTKNRINDEIIHKQMEYIVKRGLASNRGATWEVTPHRIPPTFKNECWVFSYELELEKTRGHQGGETESRQFAEIKAIMMQAGNAGNFQKNPWVVLGDEVQNTEQETHSQSIENIITEVGEEIANKFLNGVREVTSIRNVKTWNDLAIPPEFLGEDSDKALSEHEAWKNLYDLGPQVRLLMNNIHRAATTNGESRNHAVLFGHSGCGKTTTLLAFERMFGEGSVLRLDATSTTKAGLEKMFFSDLTEIPPLVFMEEAEKADPDALKIWLGALDDRGEIRKVNFRKNELRAVKVLFFCTVNNKALFDRMMGSDGSQNGALSSRCVSQIYFPRPSNDTLRQILKKEIDQNGGNYDWITPALDLAREMKTADPRIVRHYLAGGDRLLNGSYQRDWKAVQHAQEMFQRQNIE